MPTTVFVKADGTIFETWTGPLDGVTLAQLVDAMFKDIVPQSGSYTRAKGESTSTLIRIPAGFTLASVYSLCAGGFETSPASLGYHFPGIWNARWT